MRGRRRGRGWVTAVGGAAINAVVVAADGVWGNGVQWFQWLALGIWAVLAVVGVIERVTRQ